MAKRRPVGSQSAAPSKARSNRGGEAPESAPIFSGVGGFDPMSLGTGLLGAALVYLSYYPSDSVAVERGDALWFSALALCIATIVWASWSWMRPGPAVERRSDRFRWSAAGLLDVAAWSLAGWMMISAVATCPPGNLRMATNEAWLWVAAAAIFTSTRRLLVDVRLRQAVLMLLVVCSVGLAVHGLHQYYVSLPENREQYRLDPDRVLELAGVDAPEGSAERMVFENRLLDGGPTGTFALANSLAAVLLVGVVLATGVLRCHWANLSVPSRVGWGVISIVCASCLLAARSRSATLAMLIGVALILIASSTMRRRNPKTLVVGLAGVLLVGLLGAVVIAIKGNREWYEQAPASLAFRFQYWRGTWQMVLDHPVFGAGPGNFQSIYERYREASATEQIAEPHNFFFETLASGGFVAAGILLLLIALAMITIARRLQATGDAGGPPAASSTIGGRWLWLGAILSLGMIWLLGLASRQPPDLQASLFVLPSAAFAAAVLWPTIQNLDSGDVDSIMGVALVSLGVHLTVSGGWTVPGLAIIVWISAGMLTRYTMAAGDEAQRGAGRKLHWVSTGTILACGVFMLVELYVHSIRPVDEQKRLMSIAAAAQSTNQFGKARLARQQAAEADPWSPDAVLWLADMYRWRLIADQNDAEARERWIESLQEIRRRGGDDPAIYRMVGAQQIHLYQRHGLQEDLDSAAESFNAAVQWSPSNQWMMAQAAVLAMARGEPERAAELGRRAYELSRLGGNIERDLSRQQVYVPRILGTAAQRRPIRQPADQLLPEPDRDQ